MQERMLSRLDASFVSFSRAQEQKAALAQVTALRLKEQLQRAELEKKAYGDKLEAGQLSDEEIQLLAYKNDLRAGLTIEDVLR